MCAAQRSPRDARLPTRAAQRFGAEKSKANKAKNAIDFTEAAILWNDERRIEIPARTVGEARVLVIGVIGIISVRRSRAEEVELYEGQNQ